MMLIIIIILMMLMQGARLVSPQAATGPPLVAGQPGTAWVPTRWPLIPAYPHTLQYLAYPHIPGHNSYLANLALPGCPPGGHPSYFIIMVLIIMSMIKEAIIYHGNPNNITLN